MHANRRKQTPKGTAFMKTIVTGIFALGFIACASNTTNTPAKALEKPAAVTTTRTTTTTTVVRTVNKEEDLASCRLARVHFATKSADIDSEDRGALDRVATCLKQNKGINVSIEGNSDEHGTEEFNRDLADKRANAVEEYLENQGVASKQLDTVAYGQANPMCSEPTEKCWSVNRRTSVRPRSAKR